MGVRNVIILIQTIGLEKSDLSFHSKVTLDLGFEKLYMRLRKSWVTGTYLQVTRYIKHLDKNASCIFFNFGILKSFYSVVFQEYWNDREGVACDVSGTIRRHFLSVYLKRYLGDTKWFFAKKGKVGQEVWEPLVSFFLILQSSINCNLARGMPKSR